MNRNRSRKPDDPELPPHGLLTAAYTALFVFVIFCVVASVLPDSRLWGINHLAFYPWPIRVAGLVIMLVSLLPAPRRAVLQALDVFSTALGERRWLAAAVLAGASFGLFIACASSTNLLGDGLYVGNNIERAAKVDSGTFAAVLKEPDPNYPGTEMLNLTVSRVAAHALGVPPVAVVRVMNAFLGALLVWIAVVLCRPSGSVSVSGSAPGTMGVPFVVLAFLSGAVQLFFGYIEAYAPLIFFAALFAMWGVRAINRGAGVWGPTVFALAAVGMHVLGLVLFPALGVVILWVTCGRSANKRFFRGTLVLGALTIAAPPLAVVVGGLGSSVLPLVSRDHSYGVLSPSHFADIANEILLLCPGFFVLGGIALTLWVSRMRLGRSARGSGSPGATENKRDDASLPVVLFGFFLFVPALLFLLFFKPTLGMARDWDLFAVTSVPIAVFLYSMWRRAELDAAGRGILEAVLPPVIVMTTVLTSAWIGVNADAGRSVARFESILVYDRTDAGYAYETLASHHHDRKDFAAEIKALEKAVEASRNPRYLFILGLRYYHVGEKQKAVSTLETCLQVKPDYNEAREALVQMLLFTERYDDLLVVCAEGSRLVPTNPVYPLYLGMAYLNKNRISDARDAFERCLRLNPPPEVVSEVDRLLGSLPSTTGGSKPQDETKRTTP